MTGLPLKALADATTKGGDWLRTGDRGVITNDLLYVDGRLKDALIAKGFKGLLQNSNGLRPLSATSFPPLGLQRRCWTRSTVRTRSC